MFIIRSLFVMVAFTQVPSPLSAQSTDPLARNPLAAYRDWNVPRWAFDALDDQFNIQYEWHDSVNPFYQRGDFDGDGQGDLAILLRQKSTRKVGIAFIHRSTQAVHVVGAGIPFGNGGDDFTWLGVWTVEDGVALSEVEGFRAEVLFVAKPESAGGLIYWDGKRYQWVQRGD